MWNARLHESQAGIKIARRNINSLIYAYDATLMAESAKELQSLLMKVKEKTETVGLKFNIQTSKIFLIALLGSLSEHLKMTKQKHCQPPLPNLEVTECSVHRIHSSTKI